MIPMRVATLEGERGLADVDLPLDLEAVLPGRGDWEVEIGVGKGRYLLRRAGEEPTTRFIGLEVVSKYYRRVRDRMLRRRLGNLLVLRAEALYALAVALPAGFAAALHVYFPDPWPKERHQKRRLFAPDSLDLLLGLLRPGGKLYFATDFLEYGQTVVELLGGLPELAVELLQEPWPEGARTNYEAKYARQGRPVIRLVASLEHPVEAGREVLSAWRSPR
jgi:tRNA (guanine-N7-)-methyltransferase